jgi:hypothetical protein
MNYIGASLMRMNLRNNNVKHALMYLNSVQVNRSGSRSAGPVHSGSIAVIFKDRGQEQ